MSIGWESPEEYLRKRRGETFGGTFDASTPRSPSSDWQSPEEFLAAPKPVTPPQGPGPLGQFGLDILGRGEPLKHPVEPSSDIWQGIRNLPRRVGEIVSRPGLALRELLTLPGTMLQTGPLSTAAGFNPMFAPDDEEARGDYWAQQGVNAAIGHGFRAAPRYSPTGSIPASRALVPTTVAAPAPQVAPRSLPAPGGPLTLPAAIAPRPDLAPRPAIPMEGAIPMPTRFTARGPLTLTDLRPKTQMEWEQGLSEAPITTRPSPPSMTGPVSRETAALENPPIMPPTRPSILPSEEVRGVVRNPGWRTEQVRPIRLEDLPKRKPPQRVPIPVGEYEQRLAAESPIIVRAAARDESWVTPELLKKHYANESLVNASKIGDTVAAREALAILESLGASASNTASHLRGAGMDLPRGATFAQIREALVPRPIMDAEALAARTGATTSAQRMVSADLARQVEERTAPPEMVADLQGAADRAKARMEAQALEWPIEQPKVQMPDAPVASEYVRSRPELMARHDAATDVVDAFRRGDRQRMLLAMEEWRKTGGKAETLLTRMKEAGVDVSSIIAELRGGRPGGKSGGVRRFLRESKGEGEVGLGIPEIARGIIRQAQGVANRRRPMTMHDLIESGAPQEQIVRTRDAFMAKLRELPTAYRAEPGPAGSRTGLVNPRGGWGPGWKPLGESVSLGDMAVGDLFVNENGMMFRVTTARGGPEVGAERVASTGEPIPGVAYHLNRRDRVWPAQVDGGGGAVVRRVGEDWEPYDAFETREQADQYARHSIALGDGETRVVDLGSDTRLRYQVEQRVSGDVDRVAGGMEQAVEIAAEKNAEAQRRVKIGLGDFVRSEGGSASLEHALTGGGATVARGLARVLAAKRPKVSREAQPEQIENYLSLAKRATPEQVTQALQWHERAREIAEDWAQKTGYPAKNVVAAIAALSPGKGWRFPYDGRLDNLTAALQLIGEVDRSGGMLAGDSPAWKFALRGAQVRKAVDALNAKGDPFDLLTGPKEHDFAHGLWGEDVSAVDRHMISGGKGVTPTEEGASRVSNIQFVQLKRAADQAADRYTQEVGWPHGTPSNPRAAFQALTWLVQRGAKTDRRGFGGQDFPAEGESVTQVGQRHPITSEISGSTVGLLRSQADRLIAETERSGGASVVGGQLRREGVDLHGYSVGTKGGIVVDELTPEILQQFRQDHPGDFGTWKSEGKYYLDPIVNTMDRAEAMKIARDPENKQQAIRDHDNKADIQVEPERVGLDRFLKEETGQGRVDLGISDMFKKRGSREDKIDRALRDYADTPKGMVDLVSGTLLEPDSPVSGLVARSGRLFHDGGMMEGHGELLRQAGIDAVGAQARGRAMADRGLVRVWVLRDKDGLPHMGIETFLPVTDAQLAPLRELYARVKRERGDVYVDDNGTGLRVALTKEDFLRDEGGSARVDLGLSDLFAKRPKDLGRQVYESIRSLKSLVDLPLGRQGIRVIGNPIAFAKGAVEAFPAYKQGPKYAKRWLEDRQRDPMWKTIVDDMGVELTDPTAGSVVGKMAREEYFPGGAIEKVPLLGGAVQHSNAAYSHSLNVMRWEKAKSDLKTAQFLYKNLLKKDGPLPEGELKALGRIVNVSTGRGQLGKFSAVGDTLGSALFSPRNTVSWPQFFTDWIKYAREGNGAAAMVHAKTLVSWLGFALGAVALHEALTGEKQEYDWRSADFLKLKQGDRRIDIMGGGQQWIVLAGRAMSGETKAAGGQARPNTLGDLLGAFITNRSHPALTLSARAGRLGLDMLKRGVEGKEFTGTTQDPFTEVKSQYGVAELALGAAAPIIGEQFVDALRFEMEIENKTLEEALATAAADFVLAFPGFGVDRYRAGAKMGPLGGEMPSEPPKGRRLPEGTVRPGLPAPRLLTR